MPGVRELKASCDDCSRHKVKCSQARPCCTRCFRRGHACTYSPSRRSGRPCKPAAPPLGASRPTHAAEKAKSKRQPPSWCRAERNQATAASSGPSPPRVGSQINHIHAGDELASGVSESKSAAAPTAEQAAPVSEWSWQDFICHPDPMTSLEGAGGEGGGEWGSEVVHPRDPQLEGATRTHELEDTVAVLAGECSVLCGVLDHVQQRLHTLLQQLATEVIIPVT